MQPWAIPTLQSWVERVCGEHITSDLSWSKQVVYKKARQKIGILYRKYYQHATPSTMLQLYLSCIRRDLEYAVPAWDPHQQGPNQFTRSCPEIRHESVY